MDEYQKARRIEGERITKEFLEGLHKHVAANTMGEDPAVVKQVFFGAQLALEHLDAQDPKAIRLINILPVSPEFSPEGKSHMVGISGGLSLAPQFLDIITAHHVEIVNGEI